MTQKSKIIISIILILGIFISGFIIGRKSIDVKTITNTKYIKGDTVRDSIPVLIPVKETIPPDTADIIKTCVRDGLFYDLFPTKIKDSVIVINAQDTTLVLRDWGTERLYSETLIDSDSIGKFDIDISVKYNRLYNLSYNFVPITKSIESTVTKVKRFEPFGGVGVFTNSQVNLQFGAYFEQHYGVSYMPVYNIKSKEWVHGLQVTYKF